MALKTSTVPSDQLDSILQQLSEIRRLDLSSYKRSALGRRMEQRMRLRSCISADQYCALLRQEASEVDALLSALFVKATSFFRDPPLWEKLRQLVLPAIVGRTGSGGAVRAWSVGCATGEEAYSIAMLLSELSSGHDFSFKVFATDRDAGAIAAAGRGRFSPEQVRGLSPELLERWLERTADGYTVRRELRRSIIFGVQDLIIDAPISRVDLILCRNLFSYLDSAGQRRSLMHLHQGLKPDGVIVLGKSETLPSSDGLFAPVELPLRIYRKCAAEPLKVFGLFAHKPAPSVVVDDAQSGDASAQAYAAALDAVDCAVVVCKEGIVTLWNYGAERLFGRIGGEVVGKPIGRLRLDGAAGERLLECFAPASHGETHSEEVFKERTGRILRFKVRPFTVQHQQHGVICLAWDITETHRAAENLRLAEEREEQNNAKYRDIITQLQASNEGLEEINEELRSANQELQTTNEELQSTNEELEAANEELQLTRAELKVEPVRAYQNSTEISLAGLLQQAVMQSSAIAVLGVDAGGRVNLCNPGAERLLNCPENQMLHRSLQRASLAPLPEHVAGRIKHAVGQKLPLSIEAFDCAIGADKVKLNCRLIPLAGEGRDGSALLIIEPAQGPTAGPPWR